MSILEYHSWSFLGIFEVKSNLSVTRLFQCRKNSHWENRLTQRDNFICFHFLINEFQERFYSKLAKIYSYWILFDSQRISVSLGFLLLWQVNFYSKQVGSCLFWVFSLIMRIRNLQFKYEVLIQRKMALHTQK